MKKLFVETEAEITVAYKKCFKKRLSYSSLRPLFSSHFIKSLNQLDTLLSKNDMAAAGNRMVKFIKDFGTHYMIESDLGFAIRYEERFASRSVDKEEEKEREKCSGFGVEACVGAKASAGMFFRIDFLSRSV